MQFTLAIALIVSGWMPLQKFTLQGAAQGTSYSIQYYASEGKVDQLSVDSLFQVIDASMSLYKSNSLISRFNAGSEIVMDAHLEKVMHSAFAINKQTKGVFDVTVAPLTQLWGYGAQKNQKEPNAKEIKQAKKLVGMRYLEIRGNVLRKKRPHVQIDLNGIAQGYTVDLLARYLIERGIDSFIVELGGEIYAHGIKPDGSSYKVAVEGHENAPILEIHNAAVTTSGNGVEKKHIVNPKNGYPFQNSLQSVTVYAPSALLADGYDNALIGMGLKKALRWMRKHPELSAYFLYKDRAGMLRDACTQNFKTRLTNNQ